MSDWINAILACAAGRRRTCDANGCAALAGRPSGMTACAA